MAMELNILCGDADVGDDEFDSPVESRWVVAVGMCGNVVIIEHPNIHFSFFDNGYCADDVGLPFETEDGAGIYEWICSPTYHIDYESGVTEFDGFDVISSKPVAIAGNAKSVDA